jgi:hypothetical protein
MAAKSIQEMANMTGPVSQEIRRMGLGWFLLEWHAGRIERAEEIRGDLVKGSPERAVAEFLLDEGVSFLKLTQEMPTGSEPLAAFALGERHLKAGRTAEALDAFGSINLDKTDDWIRGAITARINQLRGAGTGVTRESGDAPP